MAITRNTTLAVAALTVLAAAPALAQPTMTFTQNAPTWSNPVPNSGIDIVDNTGQDISVRWGTAASTAGRSGYDFSALSPNFDVTLNPSGFALFNLGLFTHINQPIFAPSLSSIQLDLALTIAGATPSSFVESFAINHNETPNSTPCFPGSVSVCDDIVSFSGPLVGDGFTYNGTQFWLELWGFSTSETEFIGTSNFQTLEGQDNSAYLWARISNVDPNIVPEPDSAMLVVAGLAGLALAARRRRQTA